LGVDADAVLAQAVTFEGLQLVAGWNAQAVQVGGGMQLQQLASRHPLDVSETPNGPAVEQGFGIGADERANHVWMVSESEILYGGIVHLIQA